MTLQRCITLFEDYEPSRYVIWEIVRSFHSADIYSLLFVLTNVVRNTKAKSYRLPYSEDNTSTDDDDNNCDHKQQQKVCNVRLGRREFDVKQHYPLQSIREQDTYRRKLLELTIDDRSNNVVRNDYSSSCGDDNNCKYCTYAGRGDYTNATNDTVWDTNGVTVDSATISTTTTTPTATTNAKPSTTTTTTTFDSSRRKHRYKNNHQHLHHHHGHHHYSNANHINNDDDHNDDLGVCAESKLQAILDSSNKKGRTDGSGGVNKRARLHRDFSVNIHNSSLSSTTKLGPINSKNTILVEFDKQGRHLLRKDVDDCCSFQRNTVGIADNSATSAATGGTSPIIKHDKRPTLVICKYSRDFKILPNANVPQYSDYRLNTTHVRDNLTIYGLIVLMRGYDAHVNSGETLNERDAFQQRQTVKRRQINRVKLGSDNDLFGNSDVNDIVANCRTRKRRRTSTKQLSARRESEIRNKRAYNAVFSRCSLVDRIVVHNLRTSQYIRFVSNVVNYLLPDHMQGSRNAQSTFTKCASTDDVPAKFLQFHTLLVNVMNGTGKIDFGVYTSQEVLRYVIKPRVRRTLIDMTAVVSTERQELIYVQPYYVGVYAMVHSAANQELKFYNRYGELFRSFTTKSMRVLDIDATFEVVIMPTHGSHNVARSWRSRTRLKFHNLRIIIVDVLAIAGEVLIHHSFPERFAHVDAILDSYERCFEPPSRRSQCRDKDDLSTKTAHDYDRDFGGCSCKFLITDHNYDGRHDKGRRGDNTDSPRVGDGEETERDGEQQQGQRRLFRDTNVIFCAAHTSRLDTAQTMLSALRTRYKYGSSSDLPRRHQRHSDNCYLMQVAASWGNGGSAFDQYCGDSVAAIDDELDAFAPINGLVYRWRDDHSLMSAYYYRFVVKYTVAYSFLLDRRLRVHGNASSAIPLNLHYSLEHCKRCTVCAVYAHDADYLYVCRFNRQTLQVEHYACIELIGDVGELRYVKTPLYVHNCRLAPFGLALLRVYHNDDGRYVGYDVKLGISVFDLPLRQNWAIPLSSTLSKNSSSQSTLE